MIENEEIGDKEDEQNHENSERRYPRRVKRSKVFPDYVTYLCTEPTNVKEAIQDENWMKAMKNEHESLIKNNVYTLVDLPENKLVIDTKWVFKLKKKEDGKNQHRARLVARGFKQEEGINYFETYAPVVRKSTIRTLVALAVESDLEISHLDVKTAFLHGDLEEEIYVKQPEGLTVHDQKHKVWKLNKALYGLKQASRAWYS